MRHGGTPPPARRAGARPSLVHPDRGGRVAPTPPKRSTDGAAAPKPGQETLGGGPHHPIAPEEERRDEVSRLTFPPEARRTMAVRLTRARHAGDSRARRDRAAARGFEESEGAEYAVGPNGEMHRVVGNPCDCGQIDMSEFCNPDAPRRPPGPCCASDTLVVKKEFFHCRAPLHFSDQDKTFSRHGGAYHWDIQPEAARFFRDPGSGLWYFGYQSNKGDGRRTHVTLANVTCPTEADWMRTGECSDDNSPFVRPVACAPLDVHHVEIGNRAVPIPGAAGLGAPLRRRGRHRPHTRRPRGARRRRAVRRRSRDVR